MSRVKGKNTKPEMLVRSLLHRMGYRFRLHVPELPGKPDIVLPHHGKIVFINGCFWHGHKVCRKGGLPETNAEFWRDKIEKNRARDKIAKRRLGNAGWKVLTIWECQTLEAEKLILRLKRFMRR